MTDTAPVILYTIAGCPHSRAARDALRARGVPFREIDVGARPEAVPELLKLTGGRRIVPVTVEGTRILIAAAGGSAF